MISRLFRGLAIGLLWLPAAAFAHPGHEASTFVQGFAHPFGGIDHLLAMVAVGVLASRFEGPARWHLPLTFMAAMIAGAMLAVASVSLPSVELMIALSLVVFGGSIAIARRLPAVLSFTAVSIFALFHGYAHGSEMAGASLLAFGAGFIVATALLHGSGLWLTLRASELGLRAQRAIRATGSVIAAIGMALAW